MPDYYVIETTRWLVRDVENEEAADEAWQFDEAEELSNSTEVVEVTD